jgi:YggT family protein
LLREIFHLLIGTVAGLLGSMLLLRAYLSWLRVSRSNPVAIFCVALTEWLAGPLRRVLPSRGRLDAGALAGALLVALAVVFLVQWVEFDGFANWALFLPSVLVLLLRWALYLLMFVLVVNALFSWVNPHAPLAPTFDVLTRPMLAPLRRWIRPVGGVDLSPMVLMLLILVGLSVLDALARF